MLIAIDIDQVLADTTAVYLKYHNKKYHTNFKPIDCYTLDWWKVFGISEVQFVEDYKNFNIHGGPMSIPTIEGAVDGIGKLVANHRLIAVTARPNSIARVTEEWIAKFFPGKFEKIYYTREEMLGEELESKHSICVKTGTEILIDDSFEFAETCASNGMKVLLYDWPWNRDCKLPEFMVRVYSWPDILEKIKTLEIYFK